MSTKLKLLRKLKHYLNDPATKRVFMSLTQPSIKYKYLAIHNFTKTQKEKLNMLDRQAESISNNLNVKADELIYKHPTKIVKKSIEGNIYEKFTNYFENNVHQKSTRNKNLFLKASKVRVEFAKLEVLFSIH